MRGSASHSDAGDSELAQLAERCSRLADENAQLQRINETLMDRVERDTDLQGNSFSLFQTAIALESQVKERTAALQLALQALEHSNQDLQVSNAAAQAANRAKSAFLATMSHELRTPMNGVVGMTEMLLNTPLDTTQRGYGDIIRQSALSLLHILNDILDFSKIEAGQLQTEAMPFDLRQTTDRALQLFEPQIRDKGLALQVDWPAGAPCAVVGDPMRYTQVITNLLGNAVKFTAQGRIALRAQLAEGNGDRLRWRFEIEDTGIGIQSAVIPRLFESFTQSDSSITRQYGGSGLGLAIVRRLCQLMGGDCGVDSEYGKGSCFWFTITLQRDLQAATRSAAARDAPPPPPQSATATAAVGRRPRVLLVEDNVINQEVARGMLEFLGCEIQIAANGRIAVELLSAAHSFDLVLMDCQMPEMDGLEATRQVRGLEQGGAVHTPIIALTANAMLGDREQCLAAGMDDFLSKPFQLRELEAKLGAWSRPAATP